MSELRRRSTLREEQSVSGNGNVRVTTEDQTNDDDAFRCGVLGWSPKWLQNFNNMKTFMLCFVCLGIFKGISFTYFASVIPSIEKRFGFSSQSIGTIKAMSDCSQLMSALIIAHFGGAGHRPKWMAGGSLIAALGLLLMAGPELFFPPSKASSLSASMSSSASSTIKDEPLCRPDGNSSSSPAFEDCVGRKSTDEENRLGPLIVLGLAEFITGLGAVATNILGMPFVDDNVKNKNTPLYFAISFAGFLCGPLVGTALSAVFNNIYFDFSHPDFKPSDPRWISAWYLGFIVASIGTFLMALCISCFPSRLAKSTRTKTVVLVDTNGHVGVETDQKNGGITVSVPAPEPRVPFKAKPITLRDLPVNLKRLATNSAFVIKLFGQIINAFAMSGYLSFAQKFLKEQYHLPQTVLNLAGGLPPVVGWLLGVGLGSIFIRHYKLRPVQVCYLMAGSSLIMSACFFSVIGMGCAKQLLIGVDDVLDPYLNSNTSCAYKRTCNCQTFQFSPICDRRTSTSYVSPCTAGCLRSNRVNNTMYYFDCLCLDTTGSMNGTPPNDWNPVVRLPTATSDHHLKNGSPIIGGLCPKHCSNFVAYVIVMTLGAVATAFPVAGMIMIQFRIVDVDLKSLSSGVTTVVMSAFGTLPAPIILGKLIDSSCRLWQTSSCGERGACWMYNADEFRWKLHAIVGVARLLNFMIELTIAYKVRNLSFDRSADEASSQARIHLDSSSSQIDLVKTDHEHDDYPEGFQPAEVIAEARRRSIFIQDAALTS